MKPIKKSVFYDKDTSTVCFTNYGIDLEVWQDKETIGMGTRNTKQFKEYLISNDDTELLVWFRTASEDFFPVTRTIFRFNKKNQIGYLTSRFYIKEGQGAQLDRETAITNLNNSFNSWQTILKK